MSLYNYFFYLRQQKVQKRIAIPHFVGASYQPCFPPTPEYSCPLEKQEQLQKNPDEDFEPIMQCNGFPEHVSIPYERNKQRYLSKRKSHEPVNQQTMSPDAYNKSNIPPDLEAYLATISSLPRQQADSSATDLDGIDLGLSYDWTYKHIHVSSLIPILLPHIMPHHINLTVFPDTTTCC